MKTVVGFVMLMVVILASDVVAGSVKGYYRRDGTYVQPHQRTAPDGNPYNNYSSPGNFNPNTGQITPGNPSTGLNPYNPRGYKLHDYGSGSRLR